MNIRNFTTLISVLFVSTGICAGQSINTTISRAQLVCSTRTTPVTNVLEVEFDKSLLTLLEEARKSREKAPGDAAKDLALKKLSGLIENIKSLGNHDIVDSLSVVSLNTSKTMFETAGDGNGGDVPPAMPAFRRYQVRSLETFVIQDIREPKKDDHIPNLLRFKIENLDISDDKLGLIIQGVTESPLMTVISANGCSKDKDRLPLQAQAKDLVVPERRLSEKLDAEVTKEDGNFLLDFSLDGTKRSKTVRKNAFATIGLTIVPKHFTKLGFHGIYEFQPFFFELNYKAATDKTTFVTQMGTRLNHLYVLGDDGRVYSNEEDKRQLVPGIATTITGKLEIERFFKSTNLVGEFQSGIPFNIMQSRAWKLRVEPSIGIAAGRSLNQPDDAARAFTIISGNTASRWIARPFVNGELVFEGWRDRFFKPILSISYRRSFPLVAEAYLDAKGKVVAGYSRIVRDYVTAKFSFDAGKLLTPFFSYERGRQSPGYVLVDSKFRVGIGVKFKGKDR